VCTWTDYQSTCIGASSPLRLLHALFAMYADLFTIATLYSPAILFHLYFLAYTLPFVCNDIFMKYGGCVNKKVEFKNERK